MRLLFGWNLDLNNSFYRIKNYKGLKIPCVKSRERFVSGFEQFYFQVLISIIIKILKVLFLKIATGLIFYSQLLRRNLRSIISFIYYFQQMHCNMARHSITWFPCLCGFYTNSLSYLQKHLENNGLCYLFFYIFSSILRGRFRWFYFSSIIFSCLFHKQQFLLNLLLILFLFC